VRRAPRWPVDDRLGVGLASKKARRDKQARHSASLTRGSDTRAGPQGETVIGHGPSLRLAAHAREVAMPTGPNDQNGAKHAC
jgi:hypothetical protein